MKSYREFITEKTKIAKIVDKLIVQALGKNWTTKYNRDDLSTSYNKGDFIVSDRGTVVGRLKRGAYDDTKLINALLGEGYIDGDISEMEFEIDEKSKAQASKQWKMPKQKKGSKPLKKKKRGSGMDDEEPYTPDPKHTVEESADKTIDIDKIKDKKLNKEAFAMLKKGQKAYYSETDQAVISAADVKKEIGSVNDMFKYTDYKSVIAPGKKY